MVFHLNKKHLRSGASSLLVLYLSCLVSYVQANFGDRLPPASALEQSYLPPTPADADPALGSPTSAESQRASVTDTDDASGTDMSAGSLGGLGVTETAGLGLGESGGHGGAAGVLDAVETAEPGADVSRTLEEEETREVGVDAETIAVTGETNVTLAGSEADDGIPGRAGIDYPTLAAVPDTGFSCGNYALPGYYVDKEAECQVFYICQADGRQDGFLCPNGTKFNQQFLVCDWWYNVDCSIADFFFTINERIYAGPGSRAVEFPDQDGVDTRQGGLVTTAASGLREDPLGAEAPRSESFGDATVSAPDADGIVAPSDYDGISCDYEEGTADYAEGSSTTEGTLRDYDAGSTDYDEVSTSELSRTQSSLGVPGDGSQGNDSYSYLPPDEFFPTETVESVRGATGSIMQGNITPNTGYGLPREFPTLSPNSRGTVISEIEGEPDNVTPYSYALPDAKTRVSLKDDEEDFLTTASTFDEPTIESILGHAGNLGGFPNNGHPGYSYPEPLNPLNFESTRTSTVPESSTLVSAAGNREKSEPTSAPTAELPVSAEGVVNGYNYSPPASTREVPIASNSAASPTEGGISDTGASAGNGNNGYSYPEPAKPFLLPGDSSVLPPLETYLPPPAR